MESFSRLSEAELFPQPLIHDAPAQIITAVLISKDDPADYYLIHRQIADRAELRGHPVTIAVHRALSGGVYNVIKAVSEEPAALIELLRAELLEQSLRPLTAPPVGKQVQIFSIAHLLRLVRVNFGYFK